jgi:hypothetical protein
MAARYSSPEDLERRRTMVLLLSLGLFREGGKARRGLVDALMLRLNDNNPQLLEFADQLKQQT